MKKLNTKIKRTKSRKKLKDVNSDKLESQFLNQQKNISAQIIDDKINKTIVSASSTEKEIKKSKIKKTDLSNVLGELLAKRAKDKQINSVYFDRGGYKYHGRIKALADSLRKNGLKF